eukprot:scaffold20681_cov123-Skeletonema_dohrnii-CCMP3373.AAC.2
MEIKSPVPPRTRNANYVNHLPRPNIVEAARVRVPIGRRRLRCMPRLGGRRNGRGRRVSCVIVVLCWLCVHV